jgi:hypothetical protein
MHRGEATNTNYIVFGEVKWSLDDEVSKSNGDTNGTQEYSNDGYVPPSYDDIISSSSSVTRL